MPLGGGSKCGKCGKSVYMNEEVKFNQMSWHKTCFKCTTCSKTLDLGSCADHDGKVYCKACHGKNFGPSGYGHGVGAGILSTDSGRGDASRPAPAASSAAAPSRPAAAPSRPAAQQSGATGYAAFRAQNGQRAQASVGTKVLGSSNKCPRCDKAVYHAEKLTALSRDWHRACFRCANCKKSLEPGNFGDNNGEVYCRGCYGRQFGPKGVGYGVGAGALQTN